MEGQKQLNLRVCLLGDIMGNLDEGMKNISYYLHKELSKFHRVAVVHPRKVILPHVLLKIRRFNPDIFFYVHGSSSRSFFIVKCLSIIFTKAKTGILVAHPDFSKLGELLIGIMKPDVVVVQSKAMEGFFDNKGFRILWLPSGVDTKKFTPCSKEQKLALRRKYGIPVDKFTVLHVGPIRANRNPEVLVSIQKKPDVQVVIAGSTTVRADEAVLQQLKDARCIVWIGYFPNIEELFRLADCYVFPVMTDDGAVQVPLTVLEAAACNLPVVTTPFGGLPDMVGEKEGLFYVRTLEEVLKAVEDCKDCKAASRQWAVEFSWERIGERLVEIYRDLIEKENDV